MSSTDGHPNGASNNSNGETSLHQPPPPTHHLLPPPSDGPLAAPPVVLLLIGSLSPITHMHLRLLELARDTLRSSGRHVLGGYISPTADAYGKPGLLPASHRLRMAELALVDAPWLAVDRWEAQHARFVRTHEVVARLRAAAERHGWHGAQVFMVCGADLVQSMADERRWPRKSVETLFEIAHVVWAKREGLGGEVFEKGGWLERFRGRAMEMKGFTWGVSSSAVRECVRSGISILYMTPKPVVDYIVAHRLFLRHDEDPHREGSVDDEDKSGAKPL